MSPLPSPQALAVRGPRAQPRGFVSTKELYMPPLRGCLDNDVLLAKDISPLTGLADHRSLVSTPQSPSPRSARSPIVAEGLCFHSGNLHAAPTGLLVNCTSLASEYFAPNVAGGSPVPCPHSSVPSPSQCPRPPGAAEWAFANSHSPSVCLSHSRILETE